MDTPTQTGPNAEQIKYWDQVAGPKWAAQQAFTDAMLAPLGAAAMERARIAPGERVLDVGCGCGQATIALARRVGPAGRVVGVDVSAVMLERARAAARDAGLRNVDFENADAQTHAFAAEGLDVVYSRFGVMFFSDPAAAFTNLRHALRRGGRLGFVCWRGPTDNQWAMVPLMAAAQHIPLPPPPAPGTPGPFAFADPDRVRGILAQAGFTEVLLEALDLPLLLGGGDLAQNVGAMLEIGPTAKLLRESDPGLRPAVVRALGDALAPFQTGEGLRLGSATWLVTALRP